MLNVVPMLVLLLMGVGFLGFGLAYILWPARMAALTEVALPTSTARADFAATYGGFQAGFGLFLLACTRNIGWLEPGLWAATAALAGFGATRALLLIASGGRIHRSMWFALSLEAGGTALNVWALTQLG